MSCTVKRPIPQPAQITPREGSGDREPGSDGPRRVFVEEREQRDVIARIWHGWTTPGNADAYEALLKEEIFAGIQNRSIRGLQSIQLLRREGGAEVEFVTLMMFESLAAVPEKAKAVLAHFDERSQHYELRAGRRGEG